MSEENIEKVKILAVYFKLNLIKLIEIYSDADKDNIEIYKNIIEENIKKGKTELNKFKKLFYSSFKNNFDLLFGGDFFFFKDNKVVDEITDISVFDKETISKLEKEPPAKILSNIFPFYLTTIKEEEVYNNLKCRFLRCCYFISLIKGEAGKRILEVVEDLSKLEEDPLFVPEIGIPSIPQEEDKSDEIMDKFKNLMSEINPADLKSVAENDNFNKIVETINTITLTNKSTDEFLSCFEEDKEKRDAYKNIINGIVGRYKNSSDNKLKPGEKLVSTVADTLKNMNLDQIKNTIGGMKEMINIKSTGLKNNGIDISNLMQSSNLSNLFSEMSEKYLKK